MNAFWIMSALILGATFGYVICALLCRTTTKEGDDGRTE